MSEFEQPEIQSTKKFEVKKVPRTNGFEYFIFFSSQEDADKAVKDFWKEFSDGKLTENFESGMWKPSHELTYSQRTTPFISQSEKEHPGMPFAVGFNGNTGALNKKGEEALRKLGFIE